VQQGDHREGSGWTAESPEAPGYLAYADTFEEVRQMAHEGLRLYFGAEPVTIDDPSLPFLNYGDVAAGRPVPSPSTQVAPVLHSEPTTSAA
jgi:predicted RNase H-like HicB family nuclease